MHSYYIFNIIELNLMNLSNYLVPIKKQIQAFLDRPSIKEVPIKDIFQLMETEVNQEPIKMSSAAWESPLFRYMRLTHLSSPQRIEMLNFTIYPHVCYDIPIFATDFVILNSKLRIAVIDAMPLFPNNVEYYDSWVTPFEPLYQKSLQLAPSYDRKLDWSFQFLSPFACLATQVDAEHLQPLMSLWNEYFNLYLNLANSSKPVTLAHQEQINQWHKHYNHSHLTVENKRNPLIFYFGEELGKSYNKEFLFPNYF